MSQSADYGNTVGVDPTDGFNRRDTLKWAVLGLLSGSAARVKEAAAQSIRPAYKTPTKSLCGWDHEGKLGPTVRDDARGFLPGELARHEKFVAEAIRLSQQAERHCNHPFGALLVLPPEAHDSNADYKIVLKGENRVHTDGDETQHAESRLVSDAFKSAHITREMLARTILYTSAEPCAMCCGAIFWAGIRTVVYAAPHDSFGTSSFPVPCREVFKFADGKQPVTVIGPVLAEVSTPIVKGYFESRYAKVVEACRISNKI